MRLIRRTAALAIAGLFALAGFAAPAANAAPTASGLPDHIVNGDFSYPEWIASGDIDPYDGWYGFYKDFGQTFQPIQGFDRTKFGWESDQTGKAPWEQPTSGERCRHIVQRANGKNGSRYVEIIAEDPHGAIYQDIASAPGEIMVWQLDHASESLDHDDGMQVMIGAPGRETVQPAVRATVNGLGDRQGETMTTIRTHGSVHQSQWETYKNAVVYRVPAGQYVTRFTFRSIDSGANSELGNDIRNISFQAAYPLSYHSNDGRGVLPRQKE